MSSSWRQTASRQTQDDVDALIRLALSHATGLLRNGGQLVPFAAVVPLGGGTQFLRPGPTRSDQPPGARALLTDLYASARGDADRCRAVAFTAEITYGDGRAVRVEAEHRDGVALVLRVPFRRGFFGGIRLGTMRLEAGTSRLWR